MPGKGHGARRGKQGVLKGSRVGEAGFCMQQETGWGSLCAKRGPGGAGRMYMSFLIVAEESADGMVEMRGWKGKGRYPLASKGKGRATSRGIELGKQGWVSREV